MYELFWIVCCLETGITIKKKDISVRPLSPEKITRIMSAVSN